MKKGCIIADIKNENLVNLLINQMSQQTTFGGMFYLYQNCRHILKEWTFIVATTEDENMDLYMGLDNMKGIKERLFTPFANGRVSIINDKIFKRIILKNDSRARMYRCVSFDTQTVSYIERYYKKGTVPYDGFEAVVQLLKGSEIGIDYIPYALENLMFDNSRKDSVEQTLFAYEMMCGENAGNERVCREQSRAIIKLYEEQKPQLIFHTNELYQAIYLALLKMSQIQIECRNLQTDQKLGMFVEFLDSKLCRIMQPEINLARIFFTQGNSCGFFGKIHNKNTNVLDNLKNMTWDLMHLRFMNYSSTMYNAKKGDALIPYFFTYDKKLQDIRNCYNLQALAINTHNYASIPIYVTVDGIQNVLRKYCTFGKHCERLQRTPDIGALIKECEKSIVVLLKKS